MIKISFYTILHHYSGINWVEINCFFYFKRLFDILWHLIDLFKLIFKDSHGSLDVTNLIDLRSTLEKKANNS